MSDEKMKAEFEAWLASEGFESKWQEERNAYSDFTAHFAYRAWQASRAVMQRWPEPQSPPNDPLSGLEYRADGEANFYTLSKPTDNWITRIQFNGELHVQEQERILNAMLCDRNVRYGDGYHQGYWDARRDSPDVSALLEALELISVTDPNEGVAWFHEIAYRALAAHRKKGGK